MKRYAEREIEAICYEYDCKFCEGSDGLYNPEEHVLTLNLYQWNISLMRHKMGVCFTKIPYWTNNVGNGTGKPLHK